MEAQAEKIYTMIKAHDLGLNKKLAALQVREKAESKAIKADETAALKR